MNEDAVVALIGSLAIALVMTITAVMGRKRSLPRNSFFGIRTNMTRQTDETWGAAHYAAAPYSIVAATCFAIGGLIAAFGTTTAQAASTAIVIGWGLGIVATGTSVYIARRAAVKVLGG